MLYTALFSLLLGHLAVAVQGDIDKAFDLITYGSAVKLQHLNTG